MLQRLGALILKDVRNGVRNYYVAIMLFTALLFVVLVNFVIPREGSIEPAIFFYVEEEAKETFAGFIAEMGMTGEVSSRAEIIDRMQTSLNSLGMVMKLDEGQPAVEYILQGHETSKFQNVLLLPLKTHFNQGGKSPMEVKTVYLKSGEKARIPFNLSLVPLFVLFEPVLLGLVLIASMVFQEKEEGTVYAYAVTPGRLGEFLAAKALFILGLSLVSATLITLLTTGLPANPGGFFFVVAVGSLFASSLALLLSSFFDTISKAMMWLVFFSLALSLPIVSYFIPGFSPVWLQWLPTYGLQFALRGVIFTASDRALAIAMGWRLLGVGLVLFALAVVLFRENLARD